MREQWTAEDVEGFGRRVYDAVPEAERPKWAADLLDLCTIVQPGVEPVETVVAIGEKPDRWSWGDAHAAFSSVRELTLANQRARTPDRRLGLLLDVAETVAKVIYNACGASAPFDYHAGWRLAPRLRALTLEMQDAALEDRIWTRLVRELE